MLVLALAGQAVVGVPGGNARLDREVRSRRERARLARLRVRFGTRSTVSSWPIPLKNSLAICAAWPMLMATE